MELNNNFLQLEGSYLFSKVAAKISSFKELHPGIDIIRMDIGDVTLPLLPVVAEEISAVMNEMMTTAGFKGYGPEQGYLFLRDAIVKNDYTDRGLSIQADEIFISDGAKSDIANITDLFAPDTVVGVPDPVYPVYMDSNIMAGRLIANGKIKLMECGADTGFKPLAKNAPVADVYYLCSPNNPTGAVLTKAELASWVELALSQDALIIFDSAYESYISDPMLPKSIYEIPGAERVAIEVRSFSKTAGFTGLRCGYTVVPRALKRRFAGREEEGSLRDLWLRRQTTKFNGASYPIQRGASVLYTPVGKQSVKANVDYYMRNAGILREALRTRGYEASGGENSPYVWFKSKCGRDSWEMFDLLLGMGLTSTPGSGFGKGGENCLRLTGFNTYENTLKAAEIIRTTEVVL